MSVHPAGDDRQLVPRWRSFRRSAHGIELRALHAADPFVNAGLQRLRRELAASPEDHWIRADLLSALVAGQEERDEILAVAGALRDSDNASLRAFAESLLASPRTDQLDSSEVLIDDTRNRAILTIGRARRTLHQNPRDGVTRLDLALAHTVLGNREQARREVLTAIASAPDNRFILRGASAFFASIDEPDIAFRALVSTPVHRFDPWVASAMLAMGELANGRRDVRNARAMLETGRFSDSEISELAGELGTLEAKSGRSKASRALFGRSVVEPNENSLAQAEWAVEAVDFKLGPARELVSDAFEAQFREAARHGQWSDALTAGVAWQRDQPFSKDAGLSASYVAEMGVEDHGAALAAAQLALMANPGDAMLSNNAAYAAAALGRLDDAEQYLNFDGPVVGEDEANVLLATRGFVAHKRGLVEEGRTLYQQAVNGFAEARLPQQMMMAVCVWGIEEARAGGPLASELLKTARRLGERVRSPDTSMLLQRFEAAVAPND